MIQSNCLNVRLSMGQRASRLNHWLNATFTACFQFFVFPIWQYSRLILESYPRVQPDKLENQSTRSRLETIGTIKKRVNPVQVKITP